MTVLFILPKSLLSPRRDLLLYYLYCLCKSVQRSLLFEECSFSKADAKVKTFKHILQIFSEVFFKILFSFKTTLLRKGELGKKRIQKALFFASRTAKIKIKINKLQTISDIYFSFLSNLQHSCAFVSECQSIAALVLESGCKSRGF